MRLVVWIFGSLACLVCLIVLAGFLLPATRTGKVDRVLEVAPAQLTAIILDRASQPKWRPGIVKVEIKSATGWTETTQQGEVIGFEWTEQAGNLLKMRFESSYGYQGQWEGRLVPTKSGGTHLFVTEQATTPSPLGRILSRLFFNPEAFANVYLDALALEAGRRQRGGQ
jgi:hypothetical protein